MASIHLVSLAEASTASGELLGRQRYWPYGQVRYLWGSLPTTYNFTGQRLDASTGLLYYGARYYDPALMRFTQPDTLVPDPANPQALNRYAYVLNNPLRYTDPSGHRVCEADPQSCQPPPTATSYLFNIFHIQFTADADQTWDPHDVNEVLNAATIIGRSLARALAEEHRLLRKTEGVPFQHFSPEEVFVQVFRETNFHRSASACGTGCWAETWAPRITVYVNAPQGGYTFQNAAHELGHAFAQRAGRQPYNDLNAAKISYVDPDTGRVVPVAGGGWETGYRRTGRGYAGPFPRWQQSPVRTANEDFADMFLGWSYNHFANDAAGAARYQWMATNMPRWIALAVAGTP